MTQSPTIAYFGYGSLVNLDTLRTPYISAHRARLKGWRRTWLERPAIAKGFGLKRGMAFLSVEPCEQTTIEGLVIIDHRASLPSLDEREELYQRVSIGPSEIEFLDDNPLYQDTEDQDTEAFLYVAEYPSATASKVIIRSYLDAVMQGYQTHFGEGGIERFMETTANFDCSIVEDRDAPHYPRSVDLSDIERKLFSKLALPKTPVSF